jgi:hypothetical protein
MLGPNRLVIVAKDQHNATTRLIRESIASAKRGDSVPNVQHLLRHGWFVKMNDYSVTIETLKTGQYESYPLEQIVVCLGMDILNERILEKQRRDEN